MKRRTYLLLATSIGLFAACTSIGRDTNAEGVNNSQPSRTATAENVSQSVDASASLPRDTRIFRGMIGNSKVELEIKREGDELTGSYFYLRSGSKNRLNLAGKIAKDGSFTMQETDAAGKPTGEFKGKWSEERNDSGAMLDGEWSKPGQSGDALAFYASEQMIYFKDSTITTREMKETIKAKKADLSAEYPELAGGANAAAFNQLVKARVTRALSEFKKDLAGVTAADIKAMGDMGNYIEVGYNIEYADDGLISINFGEHTFSGGAHPNHDTFTINYDLKAGREIKLSDLFKPGSRYLAAISEYTMRDLKARKDPDTGENMGIAEDVFEEGAKPTAENYRNWNLTRKGLMFTFPPYQVAAYALGPQTVIIPTAELKSVVRTDGPLAKMEK